MNPTFTTRWFYKNLADGIVEPGRHTCAVCGLPMRFGVELRKVLRPTFTDSAALRAPRSKKVCFACEWYMSQQQLRRASWWLTETRAQRLENKLDIWRLLADHIAHPPGEPGYYLITATKRKHLALYAELNAPGAARRKIRFEVHNLELDNNSLGVIRAIFELKLHHRWEEIAHDNYNPAFVAKWHDPGRWLMLRNKIKPYLHHPIFLFAQFIGTKEVIHEALGLER